MHYEETKIIYIKKTKLLDIIMFPFVIYSSYSNYSFNLHVFLNLIVIDVSLLELAKWTCVVGFYCHQSHAHLSNVQCVLDDFVV